MSKIIVQDHRSGGQSFLPLTIFHLLTVRQLLVATIDSHIVTAPGLDHDVVASMFADPSYQGKGIGIRPLDRIQSVPDVYPGRQGKSDFYARPLAP